MKDDNEDARRGTLPLRPSLTTGSNCGLDQPDEIEELKEIIEDLKSRVHRIELKVLPPKKSNPWMG